MRYTIFIPQAVVNVQSSGGAQGVFVFLRFFLYLQDLLSFKRVIFRAPFSTHLLIVPLR